jgi:hypothetical protein
VARPRVAQPVSAILGGGPVEIEYVNRSRRIEEVSNRVYVDGLVQNAYSTWKSSLGLDYLIWIRRSDQDNNS